MSKTVVITGASSGVGRATVRRFAGPDVRLALVARGRDGVEAARREVLDAGGDAIALPADVADPDAVEAAATATEEAFGPIDIWINVAMTPVPPVYQPEVAADAIHWAAHHRRREVERAHARSVQLWATKHRRGLVAGTVAAIASASAALTTRST